MILLFVLCRHVTIRVRGRITFGEVRNHITAAKEKSTAAKKALCTNPLAAEVTDF